MTDTTDNSTWPTRCAGLKLSTDVCSHEMRRVRALVSLTFSSEDFMAAAMASSASPWILIVLLSDSDLSFTQSSTKLWILL